MKKNIDNPFVLTLTCIHEITRQTGVGPTFQEIYSLLYSVYGVDSVSPARLTSILTILSKNHIERNDDDGRYYLLMGGVFLFLQIKDKIIPPRTHRLSLP